MSAWICFSLSFQSELRNNINKSNCSSLYTKDQQSRLDFPIFVSALALKIRKVARQKCCKGLALAFKCIDPESHRTIDCV